MSSHHTRDHPRTGGGNKHLHHDIRNYRDLAPESLSDDALLELVRKHNKNDIAIREAIANLWNEEPAAEWITTDKKKLKKPTSPPLPERGGAGRGRGRSAPPGRGEGGRGGRGSGRSSSVNTSGGRGRVGVAKPESPAPGAELEKKVESIETVEEKSEPVAVEAPPAVEVAKSNYAAPVWGGGMSLAQKLREQELAAKSPPPPPPAVVVEETPVESVVSIPQEAPVSTAFAGQSKRSPRGADAGRGRGRRRAYRDHPHARPDAESPSNDPSSEPEVQETAVEELTKEVDNVSIEVKEVPSVPVENETVTASPVVAPSRDATALSDMGVISPVRPTSSVSGSDNIVGSPVLKMGRWGAPIESTEASSFQFGSFGNLGEAPPSADNDGDESPHKIASGLISSLSEPQTSWGQQQQLDQTSLSQSDRQSEAVSASLSVWGNTQSPGDNTDDNYGYDQQANSGPDTAPPGLGLGLGGLDASTVVSQSNANKSNNNNRNSNRSAPGSQTRKSDMDNNVSRQPQSQQYYQPVPPGIQGGFGMPYYGFDMNSQPPVQSGYGATPPGSSSPGVPTGNPSQPVGTSSNSNNQNGPNNYNANSGNNNNGPKYPPGPPGMPAQGMPAQMGAPYPPYYGNPYYQQAFYYGGAQPQNFYGRGGYPPRPYGADPYGPQGYDMYGQPTGQFDGGVYGQMPMPPMHPQQGNERQGGKGNKNTGGQNSQQQSAGAVGSVPGSSNANQGNQGDSNQAVHSGYGMGGGYNYGRPDQGSGWAPYQAGWGGGMMPFPTGPGGGGGYSQQMGGAPAQPGNNRQGGGSYNSYGRGSGGGSSANAGDSSGIGSTGSGTTSAW